MGCIPLVFVSAPKYSKVELVKKPTFFWSRARAGLLLNRTVKPCAAQRNAVHTLDSDSDRGSNKQLR
jgi:hypothetical protein